MLSRAESFDLFFKSINNNADAFAYIANASSFNRNAKPNNYQ
jgi:hypothetical protein